MVLTKDRKKEVLEELTRLLSESSATVISNYSGLSGQEMTELRKKLKSQGIKLQVTKNTLVKKALEQDGLSLNQEILDQPVFFAFGEDEVEVCKALYEFAKVHENLKILGGIIRSEQINTDKIKILALLPDREELEAKLVGSLASPMAGMVRVLSANIRGLVNVLNQYQQTIS